MFSSHSGLGNNRLELFLPLSSTEQEPQISGVAGGSRTCTRPDTGCETSSLQRLFVSCVQFSGRVSAVSESGQNSSRKTGRHTMCECTGRVEYASRCPFCRYAYLSYHRHSCLPERAEDHKFLVELACATTLTPGYNLRLFDKLIPKVEGGEKRTVLFIVCGGFKVSLDDMAEYRRLADVPGDVWEILCNGEHVRIEK